MKRERLKPSEFLDRAVIPALFERADVALPEFGFKRKGGGWLATKSPSGLDVRPDRISWRYPSAGFGVHGDRGYAWTAFAAGDVAGAPPTGHAFVDAVRELARRAGVDPSPLDVELSEDERREESARRRREDLLSTFHAVSLDALRSVGETAKTYLLGRGFTEEAIEDFGLGFFSTREDMRKRLLARGFEREDLDASGLLSDGRWEGRLVLPYRDDRGRIRTFVARDVSGKADPAAKYLFAKTKASGGMADGPSEIGPFGLEVAFRHGGREDLVLVEGQLDALLLRARGFERAAALGGSNVSEATWRLLSSLGVHSVTLALDGDRREDGSFPGLEGTRAALQNLRKVRNVGNVPNVYVVDPRELQATGDGREKMDPDLLVRRGGLEAFERLLRGRRAAGVFLGLEALHGVSPDSDAKLRRDAVEKVVSFADRLPSLDRSDLFRELEVRTGFDSTAIVELAESHEERRSREAREAGVRSALETARERLANGEDSSEVLRDLRAATERLSAPSAAAPSFFDLDAVLASVRNKRPGRSSGWASLDRAGVVFEPETLAIVGARTSHGKTTFLTGLLWNWLVEADRLARDEVLVFFSAEETLGAIGLRFLSLATAEENASEGWNVRDIRGFERGLHLEDTSFRHGNPKVLDRAKERLRELARRLVVVPCSGWSADQITSQARLLGETRTVGGVFVDYLQRISPPKRPTGGGYDRRDMEVSEIGRVLRALAVDLSTPVVSGAQINREAIPSGFNADVAKKPTFGDAVDLIRSARPALHHLREGGSEQEADLVLGLLHLAADFPVDEAKRVPVRTPFDVGVLKNRDGEVGRWVELTFDGKLRRIVEPERKVGR